MEAGDGRWRKMGCFEIHMHMYPTLPEQLCFNFKCDVAKVRLKQIGVGTMHSIRQIKNSSCGLR